ncbi:Rib/alpha-like domain-containing protein [Granulicatella sp. zg-84]|uniref:Rib/alpha-like domain-containing protein n=1 Tax=Granulicatella sp. zg-84 TaxID=2678503 RepID=UPI0013D14132|nr:Rib/alpha-like domain-containing protein [Granulicatella sp. zg-84]
MKNRKKQYNWYTLKQQFSIRKLCIGTVSFAIGIMFCFGISEAKAKEIQYTSKQQMNSVVNESSVSVLDKIKEDMSTLTDKDDSESTVEKSTVGEKSISSDETEDINKLDKISKETTLIVLKAKADEKEEFSISGEKDKIQLVEEKIDNSKNISVTSDRTVNTGFRSSNILDAKKEALTNEYALNISRGVITLEGEIVDRTLYQQPPLDPDMDDDKDGLINKEEIYIYTLNDKKYYGYNSHPKLADTDGDGWLDGDEVNNKHTNPRKWETISPRETVLFMELVYRDDDYIKKVLDPTLYSVDRYKDRLEYDIMHKELAPFWYVKETYHESNGFDAVLFETRFDAKKYGSVPDSYIDNSHIQVLAIRGTAGFKDVQNDASILFKTNPSQADSVVKLLERLNREKKVNNLYITGHSLGGYLTQRAMIEAYDRKYSWIRKGYTFNAPKIAGNLFNRYLNQLAEKGDKLAKDGVVTHYKVSNDGVISLVGNFKHAINVGKTQEGHGSRSYFEERISKEFSGFVNGNKGSLSGTGYQDEWLYHLKFTTKDDDSVRYRPMVKDERIVLPVNALMPFSLPNSENMLKNRDELPKSETYLYWDLQHLPDTRTVGKKIVTLIVEYPDRSKAFIEVAVMIVDSTNPTDVSHPNDATSTPNTVDTDGDGFPDVEEKEKGSNPNDATSTPNTVDTDGDGFPDVEEKEKGSNPNDATSTPNTVDTDGDGFPDVEEKEKGSNPVNPNAIERNEGTSLEIKENVENEHDQIQPETQRDSIGENKLSDNEGHEDLINNVTYIDENVSEIDKNDTLSKEIKMEETNILELNECTKDFEKLDITSILDINSIRSENISLGNSEVDTNLDIKSVNTKREYLSYIGNGLFNNKVLKNDKYLPHTGTIFSSISIMGVVLFVMGITISIYSKKTED